jgi:hypothetical protein
MIELGRCIIYSLVHIIVEVNSMIHHFEVECLIDGTIVYIEIVGNVLNPQQNAISLQREPRHLSQGQLIQIILNKVVI